MQIISSITRQTSQGTRGTVATVSQLVKLSDQLNEALAQSAPHPKRRRPMKIPNGRPGRCSSLSNDALLRRRAAGKSEAQKREHDERTPGTGARAERTRAERDSHVIESGREFASMNRASASFTRVREHLREKRNGAGHGTAARHAQSNVEYEGLLERLLTQETSSSGIRVCMKHSRSAVLPELPHEEVLEESAHAEDLERRLLNGEEPYSIGITMRIRCHSRKPGT